MSKQSEQMVNDILDIGKESECEKCSIENNNVGMGCSHPCHKVTIQDDGSIKTELFAGRVGIGPTAPNIDRLIIEPAHYGSKEHGIGTDPPDEKLNINGS